MPNHLHILFNFWVGFQNYYLSFTDAELEVEEIDEVRCPPHGHITELLSHNAQREAHVTRPRRLFLRIMVTCHRPNTVRLQGNVSRASFFCFGI